MRRFNIIIALSATLGLSSCDLDMTPMDQVSDAVFWQKPSDFELAANDFYFSLMEASQYIDKNSDIAFGSGADDVSDGSYLAPVNSDDWDEPWKFIQSTSYLLKKAEESGLTDDEIGRWKAEAHFFRAYNYWKLVKFYGGVPKIEIPLNTSSEQLYTPRSSQQEIIDFIIARARLSVNSPRILVRGNLGEIPSRLQRRYVYPIGHRCRPSLSGFQGIRLVPG